MCCGASLTGFVVVLAVKVGYVVIALIEMEIEVAAAIGTKQEAGKDMFRTLA